MDLTSTHARICGTTMKFKKFVLLSFSLLQSCSSGQNGDERPGREKLHTAIVDVTVIDAINGVREHQVVVFEQDAIVSILPLGVESDELRIDETIDGAGKFLIPGLWDFHVHLTYEAGLVETMPDLLLSYGITSVRDTGGLLEKVLPVVSRMEEAGAIAPRVFFAGPLLDGKYVVYDGKSRPEIGIQNSTADSARSTIKALKGQGASFIKIYELVTPEIFTVMVDTANELNMPIDSHVPLSMRASVAGPMVDSIEHLRNIELDCASNRAALHQVRLERLENRNDISGYELRSSLHKLQRLDAIAHYDESKCDETIVSLSNTLQVPTLRLNAMGSYPPYQRPGWDEAFARLPVNVREDWQASVDRLGNQVNIDPTFADWSLFLTGRMKKLGVPIGAGTDTPIGLAVPGYSLHSELEMLVLAGLTPLQAIESATVQPAIYFSLLDKSGSIDVGKQADMILLDADPLADIANTKKISLVVSKGIAFTQTALVDRLAASNR
jgi:hypothetical protein